MITSVEEFVELLERVDEESCWRVRNEPAPDHVWDALIARHPELRAAIVWNKTVPLHVLQKLAIDPDDRVRERVAMKRKLDAETFERLAQGRA